MTNMVRIERSVEERIAELKKLAAASPGILQINGSNAAYRTGDYLVLIDAWSGQVRPFQARLYVVDHFGDESRVGVTGFCGSMSGAMSAAGVILGRLKAAKS